MKFEHLIQNIVSRAVFPIEQVHGRVKTISASRIKRQKKNIPNNEIEENWRISRGIRIICQFVEDIQKVVRTRSRTDMKVIEEKTIQQHENSGYRSYHMIIEYHIPEIFLSYFHFLLYEGRSYGKPI